MQTAGVYLFFFLFLFPFCRSLRFASRPPKRVGGRALRPWPLPRRPSGVPSLRSASFGGSPLPTVAPPGRPPPNRSLRGFCGGACRPHPPLLRSWLGARRTAPAGRRPSDTRPAAPLLRSQAGARRTAPAGRRPSDTCLAAPFAPCVGYPNAPVGRDRVPDTLRFLKRPESVRAFVVAPRVFYRLPPELAATIPTPATVCYPDRPERSPRTVCSLHVVNAWLVPFRVPYHQGRVTTKATQMVCPGYATLRWHRPFGTPCRLSSVRGHYVALMIRDASLHGHVYVVAH